MLRLFHIDIHYACFGIIALNGIIMGSAPIARWMVGKSLKEVKPWLLQRKALIIEVK